jgi:uncharacterized LabA/DUF88 family protein
MPSSEKVKVFIDGSNFFYYCKEINIPSYPQLDFEKVIELLVNGRTLVEKVYYIGAVRAKPGQTKALKMMAKQMKFFAYLKKAGWRINKGFLLESKGTHHEKGVDVRIALDLAIGAIENAYDTAILVSSDTDLLPAVAQVIKSGKQVEYIGFSNRPSLALIAKSNERRLLTKADLLKCTAQNDN